MNYSSGKPYILKNSKFAQTTQTQQERSPNKSAFRNTSFTQQDFSPNQSSFRNQSFTLQEFSPNRSSFRNPSFTQQEFSPNRSSFRNSSFTQGAFSPNRYSFENLSFKLQHPIFKKIQNSNNAGYVWSLLCLWILALLLYDISDECVTRPEFIRYAECFLIAVFSFYPIYIFYKFIKILEETLPAHIQNPFGYGQSPNASAFQSSFSSTPTRANICTPMNLTASSWRSNMSSPNDSRNFNLSWNQDSLNVSPRQFGTSFGEAIIDENSLTDYLNRYSEFQKSFCGNTDQQKDTSLYWNRPTMPAKTHEFSTVRRRGNYQLSPYTSEFNPYLLFPNISQPQHNYCLEVPNYPNYNRSQGFGNSYQSYPTSPINSYSFQAINSNQFYNSPPMNSYYCHTGRPNSNQVYNSSAINNFDWRSTNLANIYRCPPVNNYGFGALTPTSYNPPVYKPSYPVYYQSTFPSNCKCIHGHSCFSACNGSSSNSPGIKAIDTFSPKTSKIDAIETWRSFQVDSLTLTQWNANLRLWISKTIVERLVKEIDEIDDAFKKQGVMDVQIGSIGLERLKKTAQMGPILQGIPTLWTLIPFLEFTTNQEYLVKRLRELARGGCMSAFKWNGGSTHKGVEWNESLPTDSAIIMHLFATYMDGQLLPLPNKPDAKPFSDLHYIKSTNKTPEVGPNTIAIHELSEHPPHYRVILGEELFEMVKGYSNLFNTILLFLYQVLKRENGILGRVHLGKSGVNILWVIDSDT